MQLQYENKNYKLLRDDNSVYDIGAKIGISYVYWVDEKGKTEDLFTNMVKLFQH